MKWYGRIIFIREGIEIERGFSCKELAEAYALGANDMKGMADADDGVLEEYTACASNLESVDE